MAAPNAVDAEWDSFLCPITREVLLDPVICEDGHTYERSAIEDWFSRGNKTSPMTGKTLKTFALIPNHSLRAAIEEARNSRALPLNLPDHAASAPVLAPKGHHKSKAKPNKEEEKKDSGGSRPKSGSFFASIFQSKPHTHQAKASRSGFRHSSVPDNTPSAPPLRDDGDGEGEDDSVASFVLPALRPCVLTGGNVQVKASGGTTGDLRVWQIPMEPGERISPLLSTDQEDRAQVMCCATNGRQGHVVTGGKDKMVRVWDVNLQEEAAFQGHSDWVNCCGIAHAGDTAVSCGRDGNILVWNVPKRALNAKIPGAHGGNDFISCCVLDPSPHFNWMVTGGSDWALRVWDPVSWVQKGELSGHSYPVSCVASASDGGFLVSGDADKKVCVWGGTGGGSFEKTAKLEGHAGPVKCCAVAPNGLWFVTGGEEGDVRVWDTRMWKCLTILSHRPEGHIELPRPSAMPAWEGEMAPAPRRWEGETLGSSLLYEVTTCGISLDSGSVVSIGEGIFAWDTATWVCRDFQPTPQFSVRCCCMF